MYGWFNSDIKRSMESEAWNTATNTEHKREKLQALSLAKECYSMKLDLLTNATVVDDTIRFVAEHTTRTGLYMVMKEDDDENNAHLINNNVF